MRIVFVGAVEGSKAALEALIQSGAVPNLVVTLPPELAGRHSDYSDLSGLARAAGCTVLHAKDINSVPVVEAVREAKPDLCMVIGWSQICKAEMRGVARLGSIGFHPAALPRLRGRAVIPWTILLGERETGSTLFWLDEGVDSGPILLQRRFAVAEDESARTLYAKHLDNLKLMLPEAVALIESGHAPRLHQDHAEASYCAKRTPEDGVIDWREPAASIVRLVRAVGEPYPGAFTYYRDEKLTIEAATVWPDSHRHIGVPGQVLARLDTGFAVQCGDRKSIEVHAWHMNSGAMPHTHSKLGLGRS
jgi:methionyl-tRNA formyltransferase